MITSKPDITPDGYYQMNAAAQALQISRTSLHRYTEKGIIKASVRRVNGRRIWKGSELLKLWYYIY